MNCWEFMKCDEAVYNQCPAHPSKGLDCWKITGTKCGKGVVEKATAMEKLEFCRRCDYYGKYAHKF